MVQQEEALKNLLINKSIVFLYMTEGFHCGNFDV
jgi:hypothetical protein